MHNSMVVGGGMAAGKKMKTEVWGKKIKNKGKGESKKGKKVLKMFRPSRRVYGRRGKK